MATSRALRSSSRVTIGHVTIWRAAIAFRHAPFTDGLSDRVHADVSAR